MAAQLVMATRAEDVEGFPAELREMLWRANFSYHPEYAVYAVGRGPGLVDYMAAVDIHSQGVHGAKNRHYEALGTSLEMAIQAVAYVAMCSLRRELPILSEMPFHYHPIYEDVLVNNVEYAPEDSPLFVQRASELVRMLDRYNRCVTQELWVTRERLSRLQRCIEPFVRTGQVSRDVLYGEDSRTPHEMATLPFCFPPVEGARPPRAPRQRARKTVGLQVPYFPPTLATSSDLLGAAQPLTHPLAPGDTGLPDHHNFVMFPAGFVRPPYSLE